MVITFLEYNIANILPSYHKAFKTPVLIDITIVVT
jgi:hypothetical protein